MELFYLSEHTSCYHYSKCMQEGFRHYKFDKGLNHEEQLIKDCILFVLKGNLQLSCNGFQLTISEGKMEFLCRDSLFSMCALENCEVITAMFEEGFGLAKKLLFRNYIISRISSNIAWNLSK